MDDERIRSGFVARTPTFSACAGRTLNKLESMRELARIIDANANRAREGLRVMEDLARFALDDADLCARLKDVRHGLRDAIDSLASFGVDRGMLLASRDTPGDVGASIATPGERVRTGMRSIALAAASRTAEALRAIEECAKGIERAGHEGARGDPPHARIEAWRYRVYEIEKRLGLALTDGACPQWRLCVLLTESLCANHPWERVAELAIEGGADCLQLREKELDGAELLRRARRLVEIARRADRRVSVVINDRPDIALLSAADGVHLGQTDLSISDARTLAGFRLLIGVSTTNREQARAAVHAGADCCGCGPMFPTTTKHKPTLAGASYLREYLGDPITSTRPHLAIGGITPANIGELVDVGCRGVAVSGAVCAASDPRSVCEMLVRALEKKDSTLRR